MAKKLTLFTLYFVYFFDLAGLVVVYVVFSPLVLDQAGGLLPEEVSINARNVILGCLFAAYPLTQFFGAPILGDLSDRFGRKWILVISILGTCVGFWLSAFAIMLRHLTLLFAGRILGGFMAGNLTVAQASIVDLVEPKRRARHMAACSAIGGLAWTVGPFMGTLLAKISEAAPFWVLGGLFFLGFFLILRAPSDAKNHGGPLHLHRVFGNVIEVFKVPNVLSPFIASAVTIFGWMCYQAFLAPYLIQRFQFSQDLEGIAYAISSVWWLIGGLLATYWLLHRWKSTSVVIVGMFVSLAAVFAYILIPTSFWAWPVMSVANLGQSVALACFYALFAHFVPSQMLGKVFGAWNACFALAGAFGPLLSGYLVRFGIGVPYLVATAIMLAAALYYVVWYARHHRSLT